ncbi:hypothetical protein [Streptomyces sp. NPDC056948]|uniref:hypothetical protein n=1 Tax=Streptomyces sp. NPDC056948 TaxID=3345975 RepID=UPI0036309E9A
MSAVSLFTEPWPEGVTARFVNLVGATVDVTGSGQRTRARCSGCIFGKSELPATEGYTHDEAQRHAERCRALPRPAGVTG